MRVVFLSDKADTIDRMKMAMVNQSTPLSVRPDVVYSWLNALQALHPAYQGITIDASPQARNESARLPSTIIDAARIIDNARTCQLNEVAALLNDDIANVRTGDPLPAEHQLPEGAPQQATVEVDFDSFLVSETQHSMDDPESVVLQSLQEALKRADHDQTRQPSAPLHVMRDSDAVNSFTNNDVLFTGAFPDIFCLGVGAQKGSWSTKQMRHLLLQFDTRFSTCTPLVFLLFAQLRSHKAASIVAGDVKTKHDAYESLGDFLLRPDCKQRIETAARLPNAPDSKIIKKTIMRNVVVRGVGIPWGPIARRQATSTLYSYVRHYGLPTVFVTIAPDDAHQPLCIRMTIPSRSNDEFPATRASADELMESLKNCETTYLEIPITNGALAKRITDNAVAAAEVYKRLLEATFSHLLGMPISSASIKRTPVRRQQGVFGTATAAFAVTEAQGRGALHMHGAFWGAVPPNVLERISSHPTLLTTFVKCLESMFVAHLPVDYHVRDCVDTVNAHLHPQARGDLSVRLRIANPARMMCAAKRRPAHFKPPRVIDPTAPNELCWEFCDHCIRHLLAVNMHDHRDTCHKKPIGEKVCRLCRPMPCAPVTTISCLVEDSTAPCGVAAVPPPPPNLNNTTRRPKSWPLPQESANCLVIQLKRPLINVQPPSSAPASTEIDGTDVCA